MSVLRLKDLREDKDMKQEDVANILGISRQYYSRYEQGQVELPIRHYKTLAKFYNVSIDYICGITNIPRPLSSNEKASEKALTAKETRLLKKYRENADMQKAVDKLLDV